jgi:hypothetical protein
LPLTELEARRSQIREIASAGYAMSDEQKELFGFLERRLKEKKKEREAAERSAQRLFAAGSAQVH